MWVQATDALFHVTRAFSDGDVTHVEGNVDPVRDLKIINDELRFKVSFKEVVHIFVRLQILCGCYIRGCEAGRGMVRVWLLSAAPVCMRLKPIVSAGSSNCGESD